jgi:hypothetical protein
MLRIHSDDFLELVKLCAAQRFGHESGDHISSWIVVQDHSSMRLLLSYAGKDFQEQADKAIQLRESV